MDRKSISDEKMNRMRELVSILNQASRAYYQESREIMTNQQYDDLYDELSALEEETGVVMASSPTVNVGYEVLSDLVKETHPERMLSLDKTKDQDQLVSWLGDQRGVLSWKLDGLTIVLTYRGGRLYKAVTRGNGQVGEVVTNNAKTFINLPLSIDFKGELVLRGEAVISYEDFEKINRNIADESSKYKNPRNLCSGSVRQLNNQITEINNNKNSLADNNKKHEAMRLEAEARVEELEGQGQENKDKLTAANARVSELMIKFNSVKQKEDFIVENIRRINMDIEKYKEELEGFTSRVESSFSEITELEDRIAAIKTDIASRTGSIADNEDKVNEFSVKREELQQSHKEFFARREELSEKIAGLEKDSYKLTSIIEKNTEKADELSNYMWEEYELTYSSAQELKDDNLPELPALKKEIVAVKAKIKSLGDVNVNAIDDYKEVSERYEFLKGQHDDIVSAETNLVNIIAELEKSMQEQFAEKFKEIQVMFDKVFKELFGGGRGALELVDTEDLLETGIRIIAQPPGKKLQNMMQLSGGEKSLTAIALLFAIQSLKPSPFCLLDEIEAALDDSNVRRFAQYLNRLTKDTQFIVISHRKGTMEAADILYGITMQEKGVSTLVSVNLIENDLDK